MALLRPIVAGLALLIVANVLVVSIFQSGNFVASRTDQILSASAAAVCLIGSLILIVSRSRLFIRTSQWRWGRAMIWLGLIVCVVIIAALYQVSTALASSCVEGHPAVVRDCDTISVAGTAFSFAIPVAALALGLSALTSKVPRHAGKP